MLRFIHWTLEAVMFVVLAAPSIAIAQTTHVVQVLDNFFEPAEITIEAGDTVRWENAAGGASHDVVSEDGLWTPPAVASEWTFEYTFDDEGVFDYYCTPHRFIGMVGTVTVEAAAGPPTVALNAGHNGNWWSGTERDGEGGQVEVADAGGGELVFVITIYSYAPQGGQIFLIGVGYPDGDSVEIEVFITSGGVWGDDYDPEQVPQTPWGTGVVSADGCDHLIVMLAPNAEYQAMGYTDFTLNFERLTTSLIPCPYPAGG